MDSIRRIGIIIDELAEDIRKAEQGQHAAGTRVRQAMQEVKALAQRVRVDVLVLRQRHEDQRCGRVGGG